MNNRTNAIKKRADTLAEYIVGRCDKLETENSRIRQTAQYAQEALREYDDAFYEVLKKTGRIEKLDDGSIYIEFMVDPKTKLRQTIPATSYQYPIVKMLFEKKNIWGIKR